MNFAENYRIKSTFNKSKSSFSVLLGLFNFWKKGNEKQFYQKYAKIISPHSAVTQRNEKNSDDTNHKKNSKSEIESSGYLATKQEKGFFEQGIIALEALHKQVLPFLLRRTKEEVLKDLPPKIIQDYYW